MPTPAVRNLIREGKTHQIYSAIQTSGSVGMQTMDAHLAQLVRMGKITRALAEQRASVPEELKRLLGGTGGMEPQRGAGVRRRGEGARVSTFAFRAVDLAGVPSRGEMEAGSQGAGHRAAAPAGADRARRLREARGAEARERLPALQERQPARPLPSSRASSRR